MAEKGEALLQILIGQAPQVILLEVIEETTLRQESEAVMRAHTWAWHDSTKPRPEQLGRVHSIDPLSPVSTMNTEEPQVRGPGR